MQLHCVHHYARNGYGELEHQHTEGFLSLPKATEHAREHGEDVDTIEVPDLFTLRELELIVSGCDSLGRMMSPEATISEEMRELRCKAASLAFNQVAGSMTTDEPRHMWTEPGPYYVAYNARWKIHTDPRPVGARFTAWGWVAARGDTVRLWSRP